MAKLYILYISFLLQLAGIILLILDTAGVELQDIMRRRVGGGLRFVPVQPCCYEETQLTETHQHKQTLLAPST